MMLDGAIRDDCTLAAWGLYLLWKAHQARAARPNSASSPPARDSRHKPAPQFLNNQC